MSDTIDAPPLRLTAEQDHGEGWECAIIEIFGHRRHAGFIREEERFGAKMLRIDVPTNGDPAQPTWETHWYGGSSIFSLTMTDAESVFRANQPSFQPARYLLERSRDEDEPDDDSPY